MCKMCTYSNRGDMGANPNRRGSIRMSCEMSPELSNRLNEIANGSHLTVSDLMRRAVALLDMAYRAKQDGHKLGVFDANRQLITEFTNIL